MKNNILITGGTSGIGFNAAKSSKLENNESILLHQHGTWGLQPSHGRRWRRHG